MISKKIIFPALAIFALNSHAFADTSTNNSWQFTVAPYLFAVNMNGTVGIGSETANVSQSFGDIVRHLNFGGMIFLSAAYGKWAISLNSLYASVSNSVSIGPYTATGKNNFGLFTPTLSYTAYQTNFNNSGSKFAISPYIGARTTVNNSKLTIANITVSDNQTWTDPIIGATLNYGYCNWSAILFGNIGGTSSNTDYSYDVSGYIGYNPSSFKVATFYGGYQYLRQKYSTGSGLNAFAWNMKLFGPVVGVAFTF